MHGLRLCRVLSYITNILSKPFLIIFFSLRSTDSIQIMRIVHRRSKIAHCPFTPSTYLPFKTSWIKERAMVSTSGKKCHSKNAIVQEYCWHNLPYCFIINCWFYYCTETEFSWLKRAVKYLNWLYKNVILQALLLHNNWNLQNWVV